MHFGSLAAAVASYLQARAHEGRWLLRIEDIDPPREQPDAARLILEALEFYGFEWDGDVIFQSRSRAGHEAALTRLEARGMTYRCSCSRKDLSGEPTGPLGAVYPGTCRNGTDAGEFAVRVRTTDEPVSFSDTLQGRQSQRLESESGDFVVRRRDGLIAYQLAVVVDDELEGITEVVRGIDIMDSTPRQIWLQRHLGYRTPAYAHIPVVTHPGGDKLSKATGAPAVPFDRVGPTLVGALDALGQAPPAELAESALADIWRWALSNWKIDALQGVTDIGVHQLHAKFLTGTP